MFRFAFSENSEKVVELVNSFFEIGAEANKSGHVFVDKSVGSRESLLPVRTPRRLCF
jgi:hypothetical protein